MIFRRIETSPVPNTQLVLHSITDRAKRFIVEAGVFVFVVGCFVADGEGGIGGRGGGLREGDCEGCGDEGGSA